MLKYCKLCIMPSSRPEQVFNEDGICDACLSISEKYNDVDWEKRDKEFREILDRYRGDGSNYDCIIPVSGGKDSVYQALTMRDEYGMSPLCVNHLPCDLTEIGWKNLIFMRDLGFDVVHIGANRKSYREMVRVGFFKLGDCCWPEHIGIFTTPFKVAVQYKVPLIIWGENSQFEYGGPASKKKNNILDRNWLEQFQMLGYRISDLIHDGINLNDIKTFIYPSDEELKEVGVTGLFLGHYKKWDSSANTELAVSLGWNKNPSGPVEGAYNDVENLDCKWIGGLHDYMKFIKFGYGRATDQLCIQIRHGKISRKDAIEKLRESDEGTVPYKYLPDFLEYLNITEEQFHETLDRFTNKRIFLRNDDGSLKKDNNNNLTRKFPVWES